MRVHRIAPSLPEVEGIRQAASIAPHVANVLGKIGLRNLLRARGGVLAPSERRRGRRASALHLGLADALDLGEELRGKWVEGIDETFQGALAWPDIDDESRKRAANGILARDYAFLNARSPALLLAKLCKGSQAVTWAGFLGGKHPGQGGLGRGARLSFARALLFSSDFITRGEGEGVRNELCLQRGFR